MPKSGVDVERRLNMSLYHFTVTLQYAIQNHEPYSRQYALDALGELLELNRLIGPTDVAIQDWIKESDGLEVK